VSVDLIVRGICCLRPGVAGLSETIRVRSLVGRFLEHSRIFAFGTRERRRYYIGSADLMPRNLDRRVEAVVPVADPRLRDRLQEVLDLNLADDTLPERSMTREPGTRWRPTPESTPKPARRRSPSKGPDAGRPTARGSAVAIEREVKLGAWAGFTRPRFDCVAKGVTAVARDPLTLSAVYYDTRGPSPDALGCDPSPSHR